MKIRTTATGAVLASLSLALLTAPAVQAQTHPVASRVTAEVNDARIVQLKGNVHPLARAEFDRGAVADSQLMTKMYLQLQRSAEQETALRDLMQQQQTKGSANYHAWLTPEQFGNQFGPSDAEIQAVTDWLSRQGFQVAKISAGRSVIEFNGTVAQVRSAFHTEIHKFSVNGEEHFANASNPSIPEALSPVVAGVVSLHNYRKRAFVRRAGSFRRDLVTGEIKPLFTFNDVNGTFFGVGPADFAAIYHIPATCGTPAAACTGTGTSIGVVGRSNINIQDVRDFRSIFNLPPKDPTILLNGPDPGLVSGDEGESDLDVEWAGAVAPAANIIFAPTLNTQTDSVDGVDGSALFLVDSNVAQIISDSYGSCEASLGNGGNAFYNALWQQAAAQGITVVVASGDDGPAGCDDPNSQTTAAGGLAVSGIASTPYNIAMGGTDFNQVGNQGNFWNSNGTMNVYPSAKGYIPEIPWNDSCAGQSSSTTGCGAATINTGLNIAAGSGGPSAVYSKPVWQTGTGVPNDGARDIPDVSLFSSDGGFEGNGKSFYIVCESDQDIAGDTGCNLTSRSNNSPFHDFQAVGGTSAATPTFAGIIALVNQQTGQRQGAANYVLYRLAATKPNSFHDVTTGNISVPCRGGTSDCSTAVSSSIGVMTTATGGNVFAFPAGAGYDLATGLGSVDVTNLVTNWSSVSAPTSTTLTTLSSPASVNTTVGNSIAFQGHVSSAGGTPTGLVTLENATTGFSIDTFPLTTGSFSLSTTLLPGGTYNVKLHYGGDGTGTFGPSDSSTISVTVAKQNSQVAVTWVSNNGSSQSNQSVPYGSPYILRVDVENAGGQTCINSTGANVFTCPTGKVHLFQNTGQPLNDFPTTNGGSASAALLNDRGFIEDQPIQLVVGSYMLSATYDGDSSFNAQSSSNTIGVTIKQAATTTSVQGGTVSSGSSVTLTAQVAATSTGDPPCGITNGGTVSFTNNGSPISGTVNYTGVSGSASGSAACQASLTTTLSALLPPGSPASRPTLPLVPTAFALIGIALFALGWKWMPEKGRRRYAYAGLVAFALLSVAIAGCGGGGGGGGGHTVTIKANYMGDTNYAASSGTATITIQ